KPQRQENVRARHIAGAKIDRPHPVLLRPDQDPQRPGVAALFADAQCDPAAARSAQAEADVLKIPFVAALLVLDDEPSVLQADLIEILAVEPGEAEAIEPLKPRKQPPR